MQPEKDTPVPPQRTEPTSPPVLDPSLYTSATLPLSGQNPPKKSKKKLIIAVVIVAVLAIIAGGVAWGYSLYQSPEKVVSDAVTKALESKSISAVADMKSLEKNSDGSEQEFIARFNGAAEGTKASANFDVTMNGISYGGSFISTGTKESYLKIKNLGAVIEQMFDESAADNQFKPFIEAVNEKWIKLDDKTATDTMTKAYSQQQDCYNDTLNAYHKSKVQKQQLASAYKNNPLFKAKHAGGQSISGVDSLHIVLTPDNTKYAGFVNDIKKADVVIALDACNKGSLVKSLDESVKNQANSQDTTEVKLEVWASRWEHVLTQAKLTTKEKNSSVTTVQLIPTFNKSIAIETPTESITIQQAFDSFFKAFLGTAGNSTNGADVNPRLN
jgi:hypothetical protein